MLTRRNYVGWLVAALGACLSQEDLEPVRDVVKPIFLSVVGSVLVVLQDFLVQSEFTKTSSMLKLHSSCFGAVLFKQDASTIYYCILKCSVTINTYC